MYLHETWDCPRLSPRIHQARPQERVDAKNAFDGYIHSMRSATEGSGDNKGLSEKMDSDEACTGDMRRQCVTKRCWMVLDGVGEILPDFVR